MGACPFLYIRVSIRAFFLADTASSVRVFGDPGFRGLPSVLTAFGTEELYVGGVRVEWKVSLSQKKVRFLCISCSFTCAFVPLCLDVESLSHLCSSLLVNFQGCVSSAKAIHARLLGVQRGRRSRSSSLPGPRGRWRTARRGASGGIRRRGKRTVLLLVYQSAKVRLPGLQERGACLRQDAHCPPCV